jgi:hypothetical protein
MHAHTHTHIHAYTYMYPIACIYVTLHEKNPKENHADDLIDQAAS